MNCPYCNSNMIKMEDIHNGMIFRCIINNTHMFSLSSPLQFAFKLIFKNKYELSIVRKENETVQYIHELTKKTPFGQLIIESKIDNLDLKNIKDHVELTLSKLEKLASFI